MPEKWLLGRGNGAEQGEPILRDQFPTMGLNFRQGIGISKRRC